MPSNEADRVARQRALQQKQQAEEARDADTQQVIACLRSYIEDIERDIPIVLRLLAERGYPGVVEVQFTNLHHPNPIGRLLGMVSKEGKSGWLIGKYGSETTTYIYLLSDGRICRCSGGVRSVFRIEIGLSSNCP